MIFEIVYILFVIAVDSQVRNLFRTLLYILLKTKEKHTQLEYDMMFPC